MPSLSSARTCFLSLIRPALLTLCLTTAAGTSRGQKPEAPKPSVEASPVVVAPTPGSPPSLTLYSQNFATIREVIRLNLGEGPTTMMYDGVTGLLEPDSVILRDLTGKRALQVREQSFLG